MTKQWYEYDYGLLIGEGEPGIGGEHGTDFNTPLFTPINCLQDCQTTLMVPIRLGRADRGRLYL
ncbi:MAG TPA: hypothetical protein VFZ02_06760 [Ktedonobacteraceae bacterium]